jgi:hypothetical protein
MVTSDLSGTSLQQTIGRRVALGGAVDDFRTLMDGILPSVPYLLDLTFPPFLAVGVVAGATGVLVVYFVQLLTVPQHS